MKINPFTIYNNRFNDRFGLGSEICLKRQGVVYTLKRIWGGYLLNGSLIFRTLTGAAHHVCGRITNGHIFWLPPASYR